MKTNAMLIALVYCKTNAISTSSPFKRALLQLLLFLCFSKQIHAQTMTKHVDILNVRAALWLVREVSLHLRSHFRTMADMALLNTDEFNRYFELFVNDTNPTTINNNLLFNIFYNNDNVMQVFRVKVVCGSLWSITPYITLSEMYPNGNICPYWPLNWAMHLHQCELWRFSI